jgi:hypothetical protein
VVLGDRRRPPSSSREGTAGVAEVRDVIQGRAIIAGPDSARKVYAEFRAGTFENLVRRLGRGQHVSGDELALVLRSNPEVPVPPLVREYLCRCLEDKVRKPRGRRPGGAFQLVRDACAAMLYERYLAWLKRRKRRFGLVGWPTLQGADWWQGPPHERAARMVARGCFPNHTWEHVRNIVSSQKSPPICSE